MSQSSSPDRVLDPALGLVLGGAALILLAPLAWADGWVAQFSLHLWLPVWLIACLVSGGPLLATRRPWQKRVLRVLRGQFVEYGGGFYGAVAVTCFLHLEWERLWQAWELLRQASGLRELIRELFDFGFDSLWNGIRSVAWPAFHGEVFGSTRFWPALGPAVAVYYAARGLVRMASRPLPSAP